MNVPNANTLIDLTIQDATLGALESRGRSHREIIASARELIQEFNEPETELVAQFHLRRISYVAQRASDAGLFHVEYPMFLQIDSVDAPRLSDITGAVPVLDRVRAELRERQLTAVFYFRDTDQAGILKTICHVAW